MNPVVDLIIAAHDPGRRVDRAVSSVLDGTATRVRVTVVAHGIDATAFDAQLAPFLHDERLRVVEFSDGAHSPAGPFQHGLDLADAEFVSIMGSDDFLEPGAVDAWTAHATHHGTDYLIAGLRDQDGAVWRDPLTRPLRRNRLDPVRDRLNYRAAPLGLIRREYLARVGIGLTRGLATGEDIELGLALLNLGGRIDVADRPSYVIGGDAPQRVTLLGRSAAAESEALLLLAERAWITRLDPGRRRAVAIKLWRMNVVPAMLIRPEPTDWSGRDLDALATVADWLQDLSPEALRSLSRTEAALADAAARRDASAVAEAVAFARQASRADRTLTRRLADAFGSDTILRRVVRLRMGR
ncbi:glycosyltransferase family 2 protein [Agromyces sp. H66]|uniref:glycosyltransferase family 2 protein n=1 Tax=Agromyces sp. H66 TaxID=2529859 RepID=UPI00145BB144|nr:glycosyltransferase family 2 protein [Agromyces sp. H66]